MVSGNNPGSLFPLTIHGATLGVELYSSRSPCGELSLTRNRTVPAVQNLSSTIATTTATWIRMNGIAPR